MFRVPRARRIARITEMRRQMARRRVRAACRSARRELTLVAGTCRSADLGYESSNRSTVGDGGMRRDVDRVLQQHARPGPFPRRGRGGERRRRRCSRRAGCFNGHVHPGRRNMWSRLLLSRPRSPRGHGPTMSRAGDAPLLSRTWDRLHGGRRRSVHHASRQWRCQRRNFLHAAILGRCARIRSMR